MSTSTTPASFARKRRIVVGVIAFVMFWPALQHVIMTRANANPWQYFGMSMYAVPHGVESIHFGQIVDGQLASFPKDSFDESIKRALDRYSAVFLGVGTMAPFEQLPAALGCASPDAEAFLVRIGVLHMDVETGMLETRDVDVRVPNPRRPTAETGD